MMKEHVKIILIGNDSVGKSSLMSSYISRHFPSEVPHVMTDAIIPPQTTSNGVTVTVMDSSSHPADHEVLEQKLLMADSIVALYDVTRQETFDDLNQIWFPLLNTLFGDHPKPVIVVGTKTDLVVDDVDDTEQLRGLLEVSSFVRVCLKCSALQLLDVEEVFYYGVEAVIYPLEPLFDILAHEFKPACRRAFLRIFRALDVDNDNLLSDAEFRETEQRCFNLQISDDELLEMKQRIAVVEGGLSRGKGGTQDLVTFEGFLGLIEMVIEDTSFRVPWQILQRFDYDEDLECNIPDEVIKVPQLRSDQVTELSRDARDFLLGLACAAYDETRPPSLPGGAVEGDSNDEAEHAGGGMLTWEAISFIMSVIPSDVAHPWAQPPSFICVWREESAEQATTELSLQQSILLPNLPHIGANLSFDAWLTQWHILAISNPVLTQELLFRLGYVERPDFGLVVSSGCLEKISRYSPPAPSLFSNWFSKGATEKPPASRSTVNVYVLGDNGVGKSSLVWNISGLTPPGSQDIEKGLGTEKPQDTVIVGGCRHDRDRQEPIAFQTIRAGRRPSIHSMLDTLQSPCYLTFSAIPLEHVLSSGSSKKTMTSSSTAAAPQKVKADPSVFDNCDLAVLMFQCGDKKSFDTAVRIERKLPERTPRIFVGSKSDLIQSKVTLAPSSSTVSLSGSGMASSSAADKQRRDFLQQQHEVVYQEAALYIEEQGLPQLQFNSTVTGEGVNETLNGIVGVLESPARGIPVKTRLRPVSTWTWWSILAYGTLTSALGAGLVYAWQYKQRELREAYEHLVASPLITKWMAYWHDFSLQIRQRIK